MRAIYLAGGPKDGTVIHSDSLADIPPQEGYSAHTWNGWPDARSWTEGDVAILVHSSISHEQRQAVAEKGYSKLIEIDPDVGE